jgi:Uma2 family endonuclease
MSAVAQKLITAEEFFRMPAPPDGSKQELVKGVVVTMAPPSFQHGQIQLTIGALLRQHVRPARLGRVTVETGLVTERDPDTVRGPDVAYWSAARLPLDQTPEVYPDVAAELCVEVLSPSNTVRGMNAKIREYFVRGVSMVWIIDPDERTATVYRRPGEGRVLWEDATITGEDVLPDLSCRVSDFFE